MKRYTVPFAELGRHDVATVGGKNSSLGEMIANLAALHVTVPGGFATTAEAYREVIMGAGTVFWNGPMGAFEIPPFAEGTRAVAEAMAASPASTVAGGGDSGAALGDMGLADQLAPLPELRSTAMALAAEIAVAAPLALQSTQNRARCAGAE